MLVTLPAALPEIQLGARLGVMAVPGRLRRARGRTARFVRGLLCRGLAGFLRLMLVRLVRRRIRRVRLRMLRLRLRFLRHGRAGFKAGP